MYKKIIVFQVALMFLLMFFSYSIAKATTYSNPININAEEYEMEISKGDVVRLIKEQGTVKNYYFDNLSFLLKNIDSDDDLEIVIRTYGGVHLGYFFIFDKKINGKYLLVAERPWKVEKLSLQDNPNLTGDIKLQELTELSGGIDISILTAHLWYLRDGKFIEAWKGTLKEEYVFQRDYALNIGDYQYIEGFECIYTWSSNYRMNMDTNIPKAKSTTTVSIYKFDGIKFVLKAKETCQHDNLLPEIR